MLPGVLRFGQARKPNSDLLQRLKPIHAVRGHRVLGLFSIERRNGGGNWTVFVPHTNGKAST